MFIQRIGTGDSYDQLIALFPEADVIFIEGAKDSSFDKIEVVRSAVSDKPISNPEGRFLIATDLPEGTFNEQTADIDDINGITEEIEIMIGRNKNEIGQN
jgi:molybdopterin-guanine dinucleotide biosynthesis protein B